MQLIFNGWGMTERNAREHAAEARTRIREFAFNTKNMENKSNQTAMLLERRKILNR
jgi:hypothetical protein